MAQSLATPSAIVFDAFGVKDFPNLSRRLPKQHESAGSRGLRTVCGLFFILFGFGYLFGHNGRQRGSGERGRRFKRGGLTIALE